MSEVIYREYFPDHDVNVTLEFAPNGWTSWRVSNSDLRDVSYDSLVNAVDDMVQRVHKLGGDPDRAIDAVVNYFDDPKIWVGMTDEGQLPWLVNEWEWHDEEEEE